MLELKNVCKTFHAGTPDEKKALIDVSLKIEDGDFVSIIGANGAGKSTLFNAICGSFVLDSGSVYLDGKNVTMVPEHKRARQIGRLFQDPMRGSAPDMSIEENLALAAGNGGWLSRVSAADKKAFRERLSLLGMGLEDRMRQPVGLLSGGQRQALTLLMATYHAPQVLLLDEHTAALDPKTAAKVLDVTEKIVHKSNLTTFMVTHNMKDAIIHGDRLLMLNNGKIILDIKGEEKKKLTVEKLLEKFEKASGEEFVNDAAILG